ncbi:MAG: LacI family DNA-binding transcriptional regulator [Ruminococcus sp.]|jgi:LacI family transcriptional regulator
MKITMKDIAEKTGVSVNTVSLALRDISSVKKETRDLIRRTAEEMGYVFQRSKSDIHNIGLISTGERLQDSYFYMSFYQTILSAVHDRGYFMMVFKSDTCDAPPEILQDLFEKHSLSGLIILGDMEERIAAKVAAAGLPVIAIGTRYHNLNVPVIIEDNSEGAYLAVKYLTGKGYRDIGFIGNPLHSTGFAERYEGFMGAMYHFNCSVQPQWMVTDLDAVDVYNYKRLRQKLRELPSFPQAFICTNDNMAVLAAKIFREMNLTVPGDIALLGFDNSIIGKMSIPSITSIDVQCVLQAKTGVELLIQMIEDRFHLPARTVLPVTLSCKESS